MKIAFYETKPEEKAFFSSRLKGHDLTFSDRTINDALTAESDFEAVSVFVHSRIDERVLSLLPKLRYIQTRSTGYEHLVCDTLYKRKIVASNVAGYGGPAVAEFAFSLLLNATRHTHTAIARAKEGIFEYRDLKGMELCGKRLGILGLGTIGSQMARIGKGMGMELLAWSRSRRPIVDELGITFLTDLEALLERSDVVMVALPLTPATKGLLNKESVKRMKKGAIVVNVARAEIVEAELYGSLENTLCLDVISDLKYVVRPNILYTPHMAYYTKEALERIMEISLENLKAFIDGKPLPNCLKLACRRDYGTDTTQKSEKE
ncbi:NAD(P)-dependent oxidoreductase [Hydrogenimonas sp.]